MLRWQRVVVLSAAVVVVAAGAIQLPRLVGNAASKKTVPVSMVTPHVINFPASRTTVKALNLPAELPSATGYTTVNAFPDYYFRTPLAFDTPPGEKDRLFVIERYAGVSVLDHLSAKKPDKHPFLDIATMLEKRGQHLAIGRDNGGEFGILGLAFHPDYAKNGYFFVTYDLEIQENGVTKYFDRLSRFTVSKTDPDAADPDSEVPLITQLDRWDNHNGGDIHFGNDGYLYYSMGDEGGQTYKDDYDNAQHIDWNFFAAIYRLDVDKRPGNLEPNPHHQDSTTFPSAVNPGSYLVPKDNPYVGATSHRNKPVDPSKVRTEVYTSGLRNPWRFSVDQPTGRLFIGNVGQDSQEMVDIVDKGGLDFGWSAMEGTLTGPYPDRTGPGVEFAKPAYYYSHGYNGDFSGNCLIGGLVYRGSRLGELFGAYIFGDYTSGKIWAIRESAEGRGDWKPQVLANRIRNAAFGTDPRNGDILIGEFTQHGSNDIIQRLERAGMTGSPPPKLLSETGAFTDLKNMTPAEGMVAYTPNVTFWSDYAVKSRWFMIPDAAAKIGFDPTGNWTFPVGTVWMKHFDMEMRRGDPTSRRRLETRFLVKTEKGVYGVTYRWKPDQSDAELVSDTAQDEELNIEIDGQIHKQHWHYPSSSECLVCHTNLASGPLGFNTWQLNGEVTTKDGTKVNQIKALADAGYFSNSVPDPHTLGAYAAADDTSATLEWRVRSYLGANCVQCHQPGGDVQGRWDARPTTPTAAANLINGMVANPRGDVQSRWAVPGDLVHSQVMKRLKADGAPRMPPLATYELDPNGIKLMTEWINSLPKQ